MSHNYSEAERLLNLIPAIDRALEKSANTDSEKKKRESDRELKRSALEVAKIRAIMSVHDQLATVAENLRISSMTQLAKITPEFAQGVDGQMERIITELGLTAPQTSDEGMEQKVVPDDE